MFVSEQHCDGWTVLSIQLRHVHLKAADFTKQHVKYAQNQQSNYLFKENGQEEQLITDRQHLASS